MLNYKNGQSDYNLDLLSVRERPSFYIVYTLMLNLFNIFFKSFTRTKKKKKEFKRSQVKCFKVELKIKKKF